MTSITYAFRAEGLAGLGERLEEVARGSRLIASAVDIVNQVTRRADLSLRRGAVEDINLTPAYVKSKTDVTYATVAGGPKSLILTKGDLTIMGNFAPLSRIVAPGAARRAGPIAGFRSAGTRVAIRRGSVETQNQWFIMRLRRGTQAGNKFGVFVRDDAIAPKNKRDGRAGKKHIYGPSPYQLMREQGRRQFDSITDDLERTAVRGLSDVVDQALR